MYNISSISSSGAVDELLEVCSLGDSDEEEKGSKQNQCTTIENLGTVGLWSYAILKDTQMSVVVIAADMETVVSEKVFRIQRLSNVRKCYLLNHSDTNRLVLIKPPLECIASTDQGAEAVFSCGNIHDGSGEDIDQEDQVEVKLKELYLYKYKN